ncbi:MAG: HAMP domain-containing histidine kinase [Candidatus Thiodiazotropha sp. (ex Epidulcina cf. delphinae)]|nr:HAMP domain-containing histidine kinase [Candidatus Thiodiazotropha sp. (ex Epidulcina cf. delphinae)]
MRSAIAGLTPQKLRRVLALFFIALALPAGVLIYQAYSQLKWEAFHQHRLMAEELADRIRAQAAERVAAEEARRFADYAFLVVAGDPATHYVERSPLSSHPVASGLPGILGYFQVDAAGAFSTPLLPAPGTEASTFGINTVELKQRHQLAQRIQSILSRNRLLRAAEGDADATLSAAMDAGTSALQDEDEADLPLFSRSRSPSAAPQQLQEAAKQTAGQAVFDQLNQAPTVQNEIKKLKAPSALGRVEDLKLEQRFAAGRTQEKAARSLPRQIEESATRRMRKEFSALPEPQAPDAARPRDAVTTAQTALDNLRIRTFESEVDPFEFSRLESGQFVLYRKVWRNGQRYIQGLLIEQQAFLDGLVEQAFRATALSRMSDLIVAFQGDVFTAVSGQAAGDYHASTRELSGALLYQTRLNAPLGDLELIFSINRLPAGPGGTLVTWIAVVLVTVLCGGFLLIYRLGLGQIRLARQQQDFVSAVSHELKTPLTSIRMYGEMLREGWAPEEKRRDYYDFIHDESERLTRLINNVLQLARMTRNDLRVNLRPVTAGELIDTLRSKIASQVERAGFALSISCTVEAAAETVEVDRDYFTQIFINLVDNAIKFSAKAPRRAIDIGCAKQGDGSVLFSVRDYGPGIPKEQIRKIFKLFYRSENELTRETVGTGIGLALVNQLASAMSGKVDVVNLEPGAEFRVSFPYLSLDRDVSTNGM